MSDLKGILLAGGAGTRLHPVTLAVSKQLVPVYDKPMVYYPLSTLMLSGVRQVLMITTPEDQAGFKRLLGNGNELGLEISYAVQESPDGIAQAFLIADDCGFLKNGRVVLALGDNIFHGYGLSGILQNAAARTEGGTIFGYRVKDPERYGVVTFDENKKAISLIEKPKTPESPYAVPGLYFYDSEVTAIARALKPSDRGELEITDVNRVYLERGSLQVELLGRGIAWLDTGTHESLLQASNFIHAIEERQGIKVACLEEIAFRQGLITETQALALGERFKKNDYGQYILRIVEELSS